MTDLYLCISIIGTMIAICATVIKLSDNKKPASPVKADEWINTLRDIRDIKKKLDID